MSAKPVLGARVKNLSPSVAQICQITSGDEFDGTVKSVVGLIYPPDEDTPSNRAKPEKFTMDVFDDAVGRIQSGERIPVCLEHDRKKVVGFVKEIRKSPKNPRFLEADVELLPKTEMDETLHGDLQKWIKNGDKLHFSIGADVEVTRSSERATSKRLQEISIVASPYVRGCKIYTVNFSDSNKKKSFRVQTSAAEVMSEDSAKSDPNESALKALMQKLGVNTVDQLHATIDALASHSKNYQRLHEEQYEEFMKLVEEAYADDPDAKTLAMKNYKVFKSADAADHMRVQKRLIESSLSAKKKRLAEASEKEKAMQAQIEELQKKSLELETSYKESMKALEDAKASSTADKAREAAIPNKKPAVVKDAPPVSAPAHASATGQGVASAAPSFIDPWRKVTPEARTQQVNFGDPLVNIFRKMAPEASEDAFNGIALRYNQKFLLNQVQ